jgi:hypothetical protein
VVDRVAGKVGDHATVNQDDRHDSPRVNAIISSVDMVSFPA